MYGARAAPWKSLSGLAHKKPDTPFDLANSLGYIYDDPETFVENRIIKLYELYEDRAAKREGSTRSNGRDSCHPDKYRPGSGTSTPL
jgi:hypothetical protein